MKDFIAKLNQLKQKFSDGCGCRSLCLNAAPAVAPVRIPVTQLIFRPFGIFADRFGLLLRLAALFALPITLLSVFMGFSYICFTDYRSAYFFCSDSQGWYLVYLFAKIFLISAFLVRWYDGAFLNRDYNWKNVFLPTSRDFTTAALVCFYLLLNMAPLLSFYLLYVRVPNPDWVVEITYFAVVSIGFVVPFMLMRFYALLAVFLSGGPKVSPAWLWARSKGNNLGIILSLFLIIIVMLFILVYFQLGIAGIEVEYADWSGTVIEYFYSLILLMLISLVINNCHVQKEYLLGGKDGNNAAD